MILSYGVLLIQTRFVMCTVSSRKKLKHEKCIYCRYTCCSVKNTCICWISIAFVYLQYVLGVPSVDWMFLFNLGKTSTFVSLSLVSTMSHEDVRGWNVWIAVFFGACLWRVQSEALIELFLARDGEIHKKIFGQRIVTQFLGVKSDGCFRKIVGFPPQIIPF